MGGRFVSKSLKKMLKGATKTQGQEMNEDGLEEEVCISIFWTRIRC